MQGIHGTKAAGADSIIVSGGYVDDADYGDVIIYTGAGGNAPATKRQIADQSIEQPGNAGLITSEMRGHPVRVTRGAHKRSTYAPASGFRYDGLYAVVSHSEGDGSDGFRIVQFRLEKLPDDEPAAGPASKADVPNYSTTTVTRRIRDSRRRIRDSRQSQQVKAWHSHACQVCGVLIELEGDRFYSEGAQFRPLGKPHEGPDDVSNLLCLCPNHHAQFDYGGLRITPSLDISIRSTGRSIGKLRTNPRHAINGAHLAYRETHIFPTTP